MSQIKGHLSNEFQGDYKRVLCVCSAGMLRSPTIALVLSQDPFNYNTRSAGTNESLAVVNLTDTLLIWADEIVCADTEHAQTVVKRLHHLDLDKPVVNLGIPDIYDYRDERLMEIIYVSYREAVK